MSDEGSDVSWAGVSEPMAREILARGEAYLQNQVTLAIASDQRASTAASIFGSMATAAAAALIAFWDKAQDGAALAGGLVGAGFLLLSAACAAWAGRPTSFHIPGNHPSQWYVGRRGDIVSMIGGEAESCQRRIEQNDATMSGNQEWLRNSFRMAILAPIVSLVVWLCLR